jgi:hypothetical protein
VLTLSADLVRPEVHPAGPQRLGQSGGGSILADQLAEQAGDAVAEGEVGCLAAAAGE